MIRKTHGQVVRDKYIQLKLLQKRIPSCPSVGPHFQGRQRSRIVHKMTYAMSTGVKGFNERANPLFSQ